jgi:hypothetical protein
MKRNQHALMGTTQRIKPVAHLVVAVEVVVNESFRWVSSKYSLKRASATGIRSARVGHLGTGPAVTRTP